VSEGTAVRRSGRAVDDLLRPLVSVVVPVYRTEEHFEACLTSLLRQTFTDFEVIVVDDASPGGDGVVDGIVREAGDGRVTIIRHTQNLGLMQARHTGVRAAMGAYVSFVDSDDEVEDRFLEVLHEAAMRYSADIVECAILQHEVDGTIWLENRGGDRQDLRADEARRAMLSGKLSNSLCNKLVKTELLLSVYEHLSDDARRVDYGEDLLTLFNLINRVGRFVHVPDPVYRYLRRAPSITGGGEGGGLVANIRSLSLVLDRILPALAHWAESPDLVEKFLVREFFEPTVGLFERSRASRSPGPTALVAELGLLGAVVEWERSRLQSEIDDLRDCVADRERDIGDLKDWIDQLQAAKDHHEEHHLMLRRQLDGSGSA
jgi:glycosyltransferase involved in cell wall biosynthesis